MFNFDKKFFERNQVLLLKIANSKWLHWLLGLNRLPKEIKGLKIDKITPNSIHHIIESKLTKKGKFKKQKITAEFYTRPRFAEALAYNLSPFCYFQELRSKRMVWRFSPAGLAYILFFGLLGKFAGLPLAFMGTTTSYYAGGGDGYILGYTNISPGTQTAWDSVHDSSNPTNVTSYSDTSKTDVGLRLQSQNATNGTQIGRVFFPIDTSGLDDGVTISAASFYFNGAFSTSVTFDFGLVQTSQPSNTEINSGDYDLCGDAINNPTEGATRLTLSNTTDAYSHFILNATGLGWISKTGYTKLGIRYAHDITDTYDTYGDNRYALYFSEYTGTDKDPYLSVTYTTSTAWTQDLSTTIALTDSVIKATEKKIIESSKSDGPNSPGTMADDNAIGTVEWVNPDNAKVSDNVYAVATLVRSGTDVTTHWLKATNFGFSIPAGAVINGIVVEAEAKASVGWFLDYVRIVKGGTIKTTNKTLGTYLATDSYKSTGSLSDLWGETWTPADINASDFGVAISTYAGSDGTFVISIDHIRITVYYTEAEGIYLSETIEKETKKNISQSLTLADNLNKTDGKNISQSLTVAENIKKDNQKRLTTANLLNDSVVKTLAKILTQTTPLTDSLNKTDGKKLTDNPAVSTSIKFTDQKWLSDNLTVNDILKKDAFIALSQILTLTARPPILTAGKFLANSTILADSLNKQDQKSLVENLSIADQQKFINQKSITDVLAISDNLAAAVGFIRGLNEIMAITDSVAAQTAYSRLINDNLPLFDAISANIILNLALVENLSVNDLISFTIQKGLADNTPVIEVLALLNNIFRNLADNPAITDDLKIQIEKTLADQNLLTDSLVTNANIFKSITEGVAISDILQSAYGKNITEAINLIESLFAVNNKTLGLSEGILVVEIAQTQLSAFINITENLTLADILQVNSTFHVSILENLQVAELLIKEYNKSILEALAVADSISLNEVERLYKKTIVMSQKKDRVVVLTRLNKAILKSDPK